MIIGIIFTIGVILVIASRVFYSLVSSLFDRNKDERSDAFLTVAIITDLIGTAMVVCTLLCYNGII